MDGGAWWAAVHGVAGSRTRLGIFTFTFHFHALEKEMATHSSVLAWRIPGTVEPDGIRLYGIAQSWTQLKLLSSKFTQTNIHRVSDVIQPPHSLWLPSHLQIRSVAQSCLTLCDPMNCSTPGLPVHHQLPEFTETHIH